MIDWDKQEAINDYDINWQAEEESPLAKKIFDGFFDWINDGANRVLNIDQQREKMLAENPGLKIKNLNDGFDLEVERLNAINQKSSKGFQIIDINPGLLDTIENSLNLPYEFIFDGTNFLPSQNGSIVANFRTVNIPIAGNFVKVEFIYENNSSANASSVVGSIPPGANIKYQSALLGPTFDDLATGQTTYSFDNYARNKVFIDFGPETGKPHLVPTSGRIFKTYFNEINVHLNIGSPKIRVTVGSNSEIFEASNVSAINSKLSLTGGGRILSDSDTVMSPFCITENDIGSAGRNPTGLLLIANTSINYRTDDLVANTGYNNTGISLVSLGYSIMWINRISFEVDKPTSSYVYVYLYLTDIATGLGEKRVHNFKVNTEGYTYTFEPNDAIRVVIPGGWKLVIKFATQDTDGLKNFYCSFNIDGYSYGEILKFYSGPVGFLRTSKWITDATYLSDFNRINCLREF